ncbi:unnamed protein product [Thelazia callipaeda]|uniref:Nucleolar protein 16 n=1 Tax=Thelazia callipaeda TaxID=103827 RepID=A0A0N5D2N3_THECL|nr:unnamed protein product [Thelazia callipaeda]
MRSVKHGRKRARRCIKYSRNAAQAKKKAIKRKKAMGGLKCTQMSLSWDKNLTIKQNMKAMGLAYDANKIFSLRPNVTNNECEGMEMDEAKAHGSVHSQLKRLQSHKLGSKTMSKATTVVSALEKEVKEAKKGRRKQIHKRTFRVPARDIQFCVYMMQKYGDDYKKMSYDARNIYQYTPKQIQRKIDIFKQSTEHSTC